jgi:hypothetical protein
MAAVIATGAYLAINSTAMAAYIESAEITADVEAVDTTNMGSSGWKTFAAGLKSFNLTVNWQADYTNTTGSDDFLFTLWGTSTTFELRPTQSAVSSSNPKYTGSVLVTQHKAVPVQVGQKIMMQTSWPGTGALTRAEA